MNKKIYKTPNCPNMKGNIDSSFCRVPDFMPREPMFANSYVPYQTLDEIYCPDVALEQGTIFPELDMPYTSGQGYMQLMELYMEGGM